MEKVSKLARSTLKALPNEGQMIKMSLRKFLVHKELAISRLMQRFAGMTLPGPRTVYWINPERIEFTTCLKNASSDWEDWVFPQKGYLKPVHDGKWDALSHRVVDMRVYRAIDARIRKGASWQSSDDYHAALAEIESGRNLWDCSDRSEFDKHCGRIDRLIESISNDGYRDSKALGNEFRMDSSLGQNEILINIGSDGFPLFQDGRHRLAIARVLGIKKVPVQVLVRHARWQAFRELMHRMARGVGGASKEGSLYQMPVHFDLSDIPSEHGCEDRWNAILQHIPAATETALDIGCNLGFFCHKLEDLGYRCFGIEYQPDIAYAARKIHRRKNGALR